MIQVKTKSTNELNNSNFCNIFSFYESVYENKILNYPRLMPEIRIKAGIDELNDIINMEHGDAEIYLLGGIYNQDT